MVSFSSVENMEGLQERLGTIAPELAEIEVEELVLYREVEERLKKAGIRTGPHTPLTGPRRSRFEGESETEGG
jgi:hypothetical protein